MPLNQHDFAAARRSMLLADVGDETATSLLDAASVHQFEPGNVLFREGERAACLYLLLDGLVGFGCTDQRANNVIIEFVQPGYPFLIAALVLGEPYIVDAQVLRVSRLLVIPDGVFLRCLTTDLAFSNAVNKAQSRLRRAFVADVKSIVTKTAAERLVYFLLTLIDRPGGQAAVVLPCDRQVLASWLGILPSSISRVFRQLEELGVHGRGRDLTIGSVERLRQFLATRSDAG